MLDASVPSLLEQERPGRFGHFVGRLLGLAYRLTGTHRYDRLRIERVLDLAVVVLPSVANPKVLRTGAFFASRIDGRLVAADAEVLDMGTGSGVCALFAARHARRVVAVDINPGAVRCATVNALLNHLEARIELHHGDLFSPVAGRRFDLILFNPPFLAGAPKDARDAAWRSSDVPQTFRGRARRSLATERRGARAPVVVRRCVPALRSRASRRTAFGSRCSRGAAISTRRSRSCAQPPLPRARRAHDDGGYEQQASSAAPAPTAECC